MSSSVAGFLLQFIVLATGTGVLQIVIILIKRKGDLKALDRTSSKPLLEEQGAFIDRLATAETKALARVAILETRLEEQHKEFSAKILLSEQQRSRIVTELATVRADLDVARAQIEGLRSQLSELYKKT